MSPSEIGYRVALVRTEVSEEFIASVIMVEIIGELGTLVVVVPSSLILSALEDGVDMFFRKTRATSFRNCRENL
jgi:hypothetical protein